jgi:CheY-like chemotaxis protein
MNTLPVLLLAEDEPLVADLIETSLEDAGFKVVVVPNGAAAIAWLDSGLHYDGLITDIRMRGGPDGWDVARHAREGTPGVPVVYMSGDSEADWTARGVPQSLLIAKPFAPAQIVTAISTLLNAPPHG